MYANYCLADSGRCLESARDPFCETYRIMKGVRRVVQSKGGERKKKVKDEDEQKIF